MRLTTRCRTRGSSSFQFIVLIQSIFFDPGLRNGAKAEQPIIEFFQSPASANHQPLPKALIFESSKPVTHGHCRRRSVPVDIGFRPRFGEAEVLLHVHYRLFVTVTASLKAEIDENSMATPEGVMKLLNAQPRGAVNFQLDHHMLAPKRPALIKDRVGE